MTKIFIPIKWERISVPYNEIRHHHRRATSFRASQRTHSENDDSIKLAVDFEKKSIPYLIRRRANFICVQFTKNLLSLLKCIDHTAMNIGSSVNYQNN